MISHRHKVVFVHIPKTGGQSIEQMFLEDLGLTWDERAPLLMRKNDNPAAGPQRLAHLYAHEYVDLGYLTQEQFDSYFKFAIVRNPYERIISAYLYRYQGRRWWRTPSFKWFMSQPWGDAFSNTARHLVPQANYVTDPDGKIIVDKIVSFENLSAEVEALTPRLFGAHRPVPHRNKTQKKKPDRQKARLRAKMGAQIYQMYKTDFELFSYDR